MRSPSRNPLMAAGLTLSLACSSGPKIPNEVNTSETRAHIEAAVAEEGYELVETSSSEDQGESVKNYVDRNARCESTGIQENQADSPAENKDYVTRSFDVTVCHHSGSDLRTLWMGEAGEEEINFTKMDERHLSDEALAAAIKAALQKQEQ